VQVVVPAIALVDMATFDLDAGHALDIRNGGPEHMAVERIAGLFVMIEGLVHTGGAERLSQMLQHTVLESLTAASWIAGACQPLLISAVCSALLHFAKAPMMPMVGQKLTLANKEFATAMMSFCTIAAQLIMLPI
jgi:hypothetical protein